MQCFSYALFHVLDLRTQSGPMSPFPIYILRDDLGEFIISTVTGNYDHNRIMFEFSLFCPQKW